MSCPRGRVRWHGIYGCGFSCPFVLKQKDQKFKADINGLPHLATAPPPCRPWPARPTRWRVGVPALGPFSRHVIPTLACGRDGIYACGRSRSIAVIADLIRHLLCIGIICYRFILFRLSILYLVHGKFVQDGVSWSLCCCEY